MPTIPIDKPPVETPIKVLDLDSPSGEPFHNFVIKFNRNTPWTRWLNQIFNALNRPTMSEYVTYPLTAAQSSSDHLFNFPSGTVQPDDFFVLSSPVPPANTCFTVHCSVADIVRVRFNNYSAGALAVPLPQLFSVTVLKK